MLGAIIGDIIGSVYEFDNYKAKDFQPLFHRRAFFTDDTVCTIAVADALLNNRNPAESLKDWGKRYWDNGGWGARFGQWLRSDSLEPYDSFGNGAAMRVAAIGLSGTSLDEVLQKAQVSAEFETEFVDSVVVKGKTEAVRLYRVLGRQGASAADKVSALEL